ncbi:MAG: GFA family protein [Myxococcota bacterium]
MCGAVALELAGEPAFQVYCHCESCRGWRGAPLHSASLWPAAAIHITQGADLLGTYKRTDASHRKFCQRCGTPVLIDHPALGMVDVPAGGIRGLAFQPTIHVHYGEKVMPVRDGLPKFKDMPSDFGGSGVQLAD